MPEFRPALPGDAKTLSVVSFHSFEDDIRFGRSTPGGPPGYNSVEWQLSMMGAASEYFVIEESGRIIGGMVIHPHGTEYELSRIFIDPEFQGKGIGRAAMEFLFDRYPWASRWFLDTPVWNTRTPVFYERMGFKEYRRDERFRYFERGGEEAPVFDFDSDWCRNPALLRLLVTTVMPFGKHAGRVLPDIPEDYLLWFEQKGFPDGDLGRLMSLMLEIRKNGLEKLLDPLR